MMPGCQHCGSHHKAAQPFVVLDFLIELCELPLERQPLKLLVPANGFPVQPVEVQSFGHHHGCPPRAEVATVDPLALASADVQVTAPVPGHAMPPEAWQAGCHVVHAVILPCRP